MPARFLLRLPDWLHGRLAARAAARGVSLNEYCVRQLAGPDAPSLDHPDALVLLERMDAVVGSGLLGVVAHGSWVRGEARAASDVDILVACAPTVRLTRALYRRWDRTPLEWGGRGVDAHFVHLPAAPERAGAVWCEAAVEGVLLHDVGGRVGDALRGIRRAIAEGRLVRRLAHGQPYWTLAA